MFREAGTEVPNPLVADGRILAVDGQVTGQWIDWVKELIQD